MTTFRYFQAVIHCNFFVDGMIKFLGVWMSKIHPIESFYRLGGFIGVLSHLNVKLLQNPKISILSSHTPEFGSCGAVFHVNTFNWLKWKVSSMRFTLFLFQNKTRLIYFKFNKRRLSILAQENVLPLFFFLSYFFSFARRVNIIH